MLMTDVLKCHKERLAAAARWDYADRMDLKQRAGEAAMAFVRDGMALGLGTGSTTRYFIDAVGAAVREGRLKNIRGVPTSIRSEEQARGLGIPLATLAECPRLDVAVDGADEVDPRLNLTKGLGGALLREKIIAQAAAMFVVIADASKDVPRLGTKAPLPVEVVPFAHEAQALFLRSLGCEPALRKAPDGKSYVTDNANYIYDCRFTNGIDNPERLADALKRRAGIVEHGLFLNMASVVLLAGAERVEERRR
jgi:ribose 5-phosphate isomerase A